MFQPLTIRNVTIPNRVGVSPMCMYAAEDGMPSDFHLAHLARFALGGAGLVIAEATAVEPRGRISPWDTGIWSDAHIEPWRRIASAVASHGSIAGIQLGHAGRRASVREPWRGGVPLDADDSAAGHGGWSVVGPSALAAGPGFPVPEELDADGIRMSISQWADAAARAVTAGFRYIELHGAHGYLLHSFMSPLSNHRTDAFGGDLEGRMRYPLEVVAAVRAAIGDNVALGYRVSSVDGIDNGITLEDTVEFARELAAAGVDVIDTSSGGISTDRSVDTRVRRGYAFHADFSRRIRAESPAVTATVGLIVDAVQASRLIDEGDADLVLLGREMLHNPNWAHHARLALGDDSYEGWDVRFGSALGPRARAIQRLTEAGETPLTRFER